MSSNKIGFLTALGLYVSVFAGILWVDLRVNLMGDKGESKAFSLRLENIAGENFGAQKQMERKNVAQKRKSLKKPLSREVQHHSSLRDSAQRVESWQSTEFANKTLRESSAESTVDSPIDSNKSSSIAQTTLGQNDTYFLAITRIINKFHAKAPVRNLYGVVCVAFSVNIDGEMEDLRVIKSSGNERLDNIALKTIRRASRNFPAPKKNYYIKTALVYKRS